MKDKVKPGTLVKLLAWLALLAVILANGRLTLLWVYLIVSAIVLIISTMANDEKEHRNGQRKGYLGAYAKTPKDASINSFLRPGYGQTGLPSDELYKGVDSRHDPGEENRKRAD